jgi:hypothetical protein
MNDKIEKLNKKITEIETLKARSVWGSEYQIWLNLTEGLVRDIFGDEGFKLFNQQHAVVLNDGAYIRELNSRKKILEGLLANKEEYAPATQQDVRPKRVGILNTGKNNTFIGNTFHGHDVGIKDEGEGTFAKANNFFTGSKNKTREWYEKPLGIIFLTAVSGLIIAGIVFKLGWN